VSPAGRFGAFHCLKDGGLHRILGAQGTEPPGFNSLWPIVAELINLRERDTPRPRSCMSEARGED
jgi:hypothetical protein